MPELVTQDGLGPASGFDEVAAKAEKDRIAKAIRPDKQLTVLPSMLNRQRRVLLVVPPGTIEESYGRLSGAGGELPMLGLAFIAASLRDQGHIVRIIDYEVNAQPMSAVERDVREFQPDVVGLTAYITNMRRCGRVAEIVKLVSSSITTILGGPQVTIFPDEAFNSSHVDMIVLSEGEIVIRNVMNALDDEAKMREVKGIWFRAKSGEIVKNVREGLVDNLDIFLPPALDLYDMDRYFPTVHIQGRRVAHLLTSRGCPFKCTFCETKLTFGRSFRYHSTERVLTELDHLIEQGFDSFQFYDDIFTANRKRIADLCRGIIEKNWKIKWMCFTRTNCVDDEMLALMKQAGCYLITFGGESGDDDLLALIKKDLSVATNYKGIAAAREHGIKTMSSFMLGLPTETREQSLKTINFALKSGLDYAIFPITEPYPGTELWVDAKKYGQFDDSGTYKNGLLSENSAVWVPHGRTREELEELAHLGMRKFYMRPRQLWQVLLNFFELPPARAFRYCTAGLSYFLANRFRPSQAGTRY